jgi:hypothetical protein
MSSQIRVIAYPVLPIAALPYSALALSSADLANGLERSQPARKTRFDQRPSQWIVPVALRKRPDGMQVIGQYNHSSKIERMRASNGAYCVTQQIDVVNE